MKANRYEFIWVGGGGGGGGGAGGIYNGATIGRHGIHKQAQLMTDIRVCI